MNTIDKPEEINHQRRRFFGAAAMTLAATQLGRSHSANAQTAKPKEAPAIKPGTNKSFASMKQIDAGLLNTDTLKPAPPMVMPSFFSTAGPTTFTVLSMLPRCWRRATG